MTKYAERIAKVETKVESIQDTQTEIHKDVKSILADINQAKGSARTAIKGASIISICISLIGGAVGWIIRHLP